MTHDLTSRALALLSRWAAAVERYWHPVMGDGSTIDPTMGCYGPGYIHWGVQSNWNYAAAMATLAAAYADGAVRTPLPGAQVGDGLSREHLTDRALAALRFALSTHMTGDRTGNDGRRWGHSWISMLGIERGMHGVPLLDAVLTDADRAALRRVLVSEATWLLHHASRGDQTGVFAGRWNASGRNVPESNIWSGALLWRAAQRYPDEADAPAWMDRAHDYFINGISIPADAEAGTIVAGKPVAARYAGANFFPNYALDHHGYLNVGYMVICTSNAAMLAFDMARAGLPLPESLMHHQADMWQVLRRFIFADGRLARIGGDSRVRYAYCQEYLIPALLFAAHALGDDHALGLADRQLGLIETEMAASPDDTFYGRRMGRMRDTNPHYFTRLESDRACVLSMLVNYLPLVAGDAADDGEAALTPADAFEASVLGGWVEQEHGAVMHRSPARLASFAWRARGLTQALCLPPGDEVAISSAEWALNLAPEVRFLGDDGDAGGKHRRLLHHQIETFDGGFATCGSVMEGVDIRVDEGAQCTDQAVTYLAFAALPDGQTCVGLQLVIAADDRLGYVTNLKGLHLNVANDLFNGFRRTLRTATGEVVLEAPAAEDAVVPLDGDWVTVDDVLGVQLLYGSDGLAVSRSATRRGGRYRSLYVEEVCSSVDVGLRSTSPGEVLLDVGFGVIAGAPASGRRLAQGGALDLEGDLARGVWIVGTDGVRYEVVADFARCSVMVREE